MSASVVIIPLRLESIANKRQHWSARARHAKRQRRAAILIPRWPVPCTIRITRIAPRPLDSDNLAISAKSLRDGIADRLGVNDGSEVVRWVYAQQRGKPKEYAVRVERLEE